MNEVKRMWVNQPSTLQPEHAFNGMRVLATTSQFGPKWARVYLLDGVVESREMARSALSEGWPQRRKVA